MQTFFFYTTLALFFTHELDAVQQAEWRLLYVLRSLPPESAATWFIALHVPLFVAILWLTHHRSVRTREMSRILLAAFCIVHAGLHFRLRDDQLSSFSSPLSLSLIYGAALTSAAYLLVCYVARRSPNSGAME
jgi:hypothetical protein